MMEFHVSRNARALYQFDQALFSLDGNVIFANFYASRLFAQKMNEKRDLINYPENAVRASQINAMGMIDEIFHLVVRLYLKQTNPDAIQQALDWLDTRAGVEHVDQCLASFADQFPQLAVYRGEISLAAYLQGSTDGVPNRQILMEEMILLWLTNANPATSPFTDLFDDSSLRKETSYVQLINEVKRFFDIHPSFGPDHQNLIDMLHQPAVAVPYSLSGQLEYIRERWGGLLGKLLYRILGSLDFSKEEERLRFTGAGPAQVPVYRYDQLNQEVENFSLDLDWMPRVVMIAKNTYVWLDQLSKKYQLEIRHLDQIPDEELENLAHFGFTGLWLIGLWERSEASQKVKQLCGNPDAVASAYSLAKYDIATDLGGYDAYLSLKDRAWQRGIRLASDMVPNHMGIDSQWVTEHPDWFISLDYSPFPSYTFNGPDLSKDNRVGIFIEDHYFSRSDASVVFKRIDRWTGQEKFVYHGNDGTSMPWNDTAQLNYLNPEVREAVIQTILHVAHQFPIIRFDAAMTLAKKHYQRLWYPEPGTGGAIPSRAEQGMTKTAFDAAFPVEFWREVVDRVAKEVPDTLLLAEAFWMMEGYFVRTLGMHRVYNSAFMNMLRNEDNANFRLMIKNTLEFDPEILKRYVNFMNNPDERTAVDQFGKGDKYFGICSLMATLPGLPMFGHGQIEGLTEKYGMEFRHAYWDEKPDTDLVQRHEREISPLLHHRYLFAGVENFLLYDFYTPQGSVNEDVITFSNGSGSQRALIVYQNRFAKTSGWVRTSVGYLLKTSPGEDRHIVQKNLNEGLGLHLGSDRFVVFKEQLSGLEFIRSSEELAVNGLYVTLEAYQCYVFQDFHEVQDNEWHQYAQLASYLNGRGVPAIEEALHELFLAPIHKPFRQLVNAELYSQLMQVQPQSATENIQLKDFIKDKLTWLLHEASVMSGGKGDPTKIAHSVQLELDALLTLPQLYERALLPGSIRYANCVEFLLKGLTHNLDQWNTILGWLFVHRLGQVVDEVNYNMISMSWIDEWLLGQILTHTAQEMGIDQQSAWQVTATVRVLTSHERWFTKIGTEPIALILQNWLKDSEVQHYINVNRYKGNLWFNKESFESFLWWMLFVIAVEERANPLGSTSETVERLITGYEIVTQLQDAALKSGYQLEKLIGNLKKEEPVN